MAKTERDQGAIPKESVREDQMGERVGDAPPPTRSGSAEGRDPDAGDPHATGLRRGSVGDASRSGPLVDSDAGISGPRGRGVPGMGDAAPGASTSEDNRDADRKRRRAF